MRNQTTIRTLIREMLNEIDRFKKEKGRDYDVLKDKGIDLEVMAKEEIAPGVPRYYFNMSNDFEMTVGLGQKSNVTPMSIANPKAGYNTTPMGYYAYPLNPEYLKMLIDKNLPYMQGAKWFTIVEPASLFGLLDLEDRASATTYSNLKRQSFKDADEIDDDSSDGGPRARMPNIFAKQLLNHNPSITWVYDPGGGWIHRSEPYQVVFLTSKAFKVIEKLSAKSVFESLTGNEKQYKHTNFYFYSDPIGKKLATTKDPKVVAKLTQHPHEEVRKQAIMHPLAPAGAFMGEISKIFSKMREAANIGDYQDISAYVLEMETILKSNGGAVQSKEDVYEELVRFINQIPERAKSNAYVIRAISSLIERISFPSNKTLALEMMDDLLNNRIITPDSYEANYFLEACLASVVKNNVNNEVIVEKYFDIVTGKKNGDNTFFALYKIMTDSQSAVANLKAIKAVALSKSLPPPGDWGAKTLKVFTEIADNASRLTPEERETLVDTAKVMLDSGNMSHKAQDEAGIVLRRLGVE